MIRVLKCSVFIIILSCLQIMQSNSQTAELFYNYQDQDDLQERYAYIDSLDTHRDFPIDDKLAHLIESVINEKLEKGDTADILGISISLMNYYYVELVKPVKTVELYHRLQKYVLNNNSPESGGVILCMADAQYAMGQLEAAYATNMRGVQVYQDLADSSLINYGLAYLNAAEIAKLLNEYGQSVRDFEAAKRIFQHQDNTTYYLWASYGQSLLLEEIHLYDEAREMRHEIMPQVINSGVVGLEFAIYSHVVERHKRKGDLDSARIYAHKMIALCAELYRAEYCFGAYKTLTSLFITSGKKDSAQFYFQKLSDSWINLKGNKNYDLDYYMVQAGLAYANGDLDKAQGILLQDIPRPENIESVEKRNKILKLQYKLDTSRHHYESAYSQLVTIKSLEDSLTKQLLKNQFSYYQTLFDLNKRQQQIAEQDYQLTHMELKSKQERYFWIAVLGGLLFFGAIYYFIRKRNQDHRSRQVQERYSRNLLLAQENERKRISRDLYNGVKQRLVLVQNILHESGDEDSINIVNKTLDEVRDISHGLHPSILDNVGLEVAIQEMVNSIELMEEITFKVDIGSVNEFLTDEQKLNIYRIAQEALSNISKHANTKSAKLVLLKQENQVILKIKDYGRGFVKTGNKIGLGMKTMQERAAILGGVVNIKSTENKGTTIEARIPL